MTWYVLTPAMPGARAVCGGGDAYRSQGGRHVLAEDVAPRFRCKRQRSTATLTGLGLGCNVASCTCGVATALALATAHSCCSAASIAGAWSSSCAKVELPLLPTHSAADNIMRMKSVIVTRSQHSSLGFQETFACLKSSSFGSRTLVGTACTVTVLQ